ncbi:Uncharacterised protein [Serratia fonticola]|uniref:Uncharacterized protein n=1 Tax=Serratia fonticola TaxID=47917 RepID=A0A448T5B7_SERFO|nr:Uncharacterised protein [Serratia fonticola]
MLIIVAPHHNPLPQGEGASSVSWVGQKPICGTGKSSPSPQKGEETSSVL